MAKDSTRLIDPVARLYTDIITILNSLEIKYPNKAEEAEDITSKAAGTRYMLAYYMKDTFYLYDDYSREDYINLGIEDEDEIAMYLKDRTLVPQVKRDALLAIRRARELDEYVELNNYYRMLYGLPDLDDTEFYYVTEELSKQLNIPTDMPVHEIQDQLGSYYISQLQYVGYIDELYEKHQKDYLKHLGTNRIPIETSRNGSSFSILSVNQSDVLESTYREFVRCYESARNYFMSVIYVYEYRDLIPYYDNFIALCIFVMAIQQVSMRGIRNATDREFYDEYMVRLLHETYGVPFYNSADTATKKLIVQNMNLLVQNKATNKVFLDIASILGFNEITIYQYYLVKEQQFGSDGRPVIKKKNKVDSLTGKTTEVYDTENMFDVHFQKVDITESNIKDSLTNSLNRVDYYDVIYYDPMWWEDDELNSEIWDTAYNYMETKYFGVTIPYRMTELLLQSNILLRMIMEKNADLISVGIQLPKITTKEVSLPTVVVLFLALMSKKLGISGTITTVPSQLIHILEVTEQCVHHEAEEMEVLQFNFDAFSPQRIQETIAILKDTLTEKHYRVVNGHDVDLNDDGTQNTFAPTHKIQWTITTDDLDELEGYLLQLTIPTAEKKEKVKALNAIYDNIESLYYFLSYQMSMATSMEDYDAIKKFYDTAFYSHETAEAYKITDEDGVERCAETFEEYLYYKDKDLYSFVQNVADEQIYEYIEHIIYKLEEYISSVNYLYVMNEDTSPLAELLDILLKFFKSYIIDFVNMTSLMIIDWDMENTTRFFDYVHTCAKTDKIDEAIAANISDAITKYISHIDAEDTALTLSDYYEVHGTVNLADEAYSELLDEILCFTKSAKLEDRLNIMDGTNKINETTQVEEHLCFEDSITWHEVVKDDNENEEEEDDD
jgi:hypothetical protein